MSVLTQLQKGGFSIGVLHLPPFPTSLRRDRWPLERVIDYAVEGARRMQLAGISSVLLQNVGDEPTHLQAPPQTVAYMSIVGREVKKVLDIPLGITLLDHDGAAPIAVAKAVGADYVRIKTYVGAMVKMTGLLQGCYYEAIRSRRELGAEQVDILADIFDREGTPLGARDFGEMATFAVKSCMADGLILTGKSTAETSQILQEVRHCHLGVPLLIGGGVNGQNAAEMRQLAQGFIMGGCLKEDPDDDFSPIAADSCRQLSRLLRGELE
ncbi:Putative sgc region protein SgcQ [Anaerotruncus sp. 2789STDY5834896]|uniref:Putative sgc region protein SgcQ n=1 Tax=uncultured Anaerotruncus sp. TaxID=905011 RepID=A0A1C6K969_9FIRM|nr:Putative sgc region protein SgcQ [uncultured Anaerotruncus sp.]